MIGTGLLLLALFAAAPRDAAAQGGTLLQDVRLSVSHYKPRIAPSGRINSVAVDPADARRMFAASETGGLFESRDGGTSWVRDDAVESLSVRSVRSLPAGAAVGSVRCPCVLATVAHDFERAAGPGAYVMALPFGRWTPVRGVFPASRAGCGPDPGNPFVRTNPAAWEISVAPDTGAVYVATDCGLAVAAPGSGFTSMPISGAPNSVITSVVALGAGHLIVGGPSIGIWRSPDSGATWLRETTGIGGVADLHAFARDPRGGDRAYVTTGNNDLFETTDGGATWRQIAAARGAVDPGCGSPTDPGFPGGIGNVHAVQVDKVLRLYFGDRCLTKVAAIPETSEPFSAVTLASWTTLLAEHTDTRDLAFRADGVPILLASDGGLHRSSGSLQFDWVGGPVAGLDALQITEITGQYPAGATAPELYFGTQDNAVWAMRDTAELAHTGGEGFFIGLERHPTRTTDRMTFVSCGPCGNRVSSPRFAGERAWREAEQETNPDGTPHVGGSPKYIGAGRWVASTDGFGSSTAGLSYTADEGVTWRHIATITQPLYGLPHVGGPSASPTLVQPYSAGLLADGLDQVRVARVRDFTSGSGTVRYPGMRACSARARGIRGRECERVGLGVTPTMFAWYEVLAVDPTDPARMIAPDVLHRDIRMTTDGGEHWTVIPGLADLVTHGGAYRFAWGPFQNGRLAPIASTISICPDNNSRVLMGSQQGGAYLSLDGGRNWMGVPRSGQIAHATSVFWLDGCDGAYVSTYGRGIYRIAIRVSCRARICDPADVARRFGLRPEFIYGIVVWDGWITKLARQRRRTVVTVTPGSVFKTLNRGLYEKYEGGLRIVRAKRLPDRRPRRVRQAMFFDDGKLIRVVRGRSFLRTAAVRRGRVGRAARKPALNLRGRINIAGRSLANGNGSALLGPRDVVQITAVALGRVRGTLQLRIDGQVVQIAKQGETKLVYVSDQPPGVLRIGGLTPGSVVHGVELVEVDGNRRTVLAGSSFVVPHEDTGEDLERPPG